MAIVVWPEVWGKEGAREWGASSGTLNQQNLTADILYYCVSAWKKPERKTMELIKVAPATEGKKNEAE